MLDQWVTPLSSPVIIASYSYTTLKALTHSTPSPQFFILLIDDNVLNLLVDTYATQIYFEVFMTF